MPDIQETQLPGVGLRHDFETHAGDRVGVISHHSGRRDLLIYDHEDPDSCRLVLRLEDNESHTLSELLGGSQVTTHLTDLQQSVAGLTIDWIPIRPGDACVGCAIRDLSVRERTGVSIVAVVRDGKTLPSPGPDFQLQGGDMAVVVGTPDGIRQAFTLLQGG